MRKAITTVVVGCAVAAGATGVATAAGSSPHVGGSKCGTKYTPRCTKKPAVHHYAKPSIKTPPVSPKCVSTGSTYKLPTMTFKAPAGLRRERTSFRGALRGSPGDAGSLASLPLARAGRKPSRKYQPAGVSAG